MTDRQPRGERPEARTPDEIEQLQEVGGSYEPDDLDLPDRPLTPDEIEQRQVVDYDPEDAPLD
jgi:hypothetical protein